MSIANLFLSLEGRISRQPFWLGMLLLAVINTGLNWIFGVPFLPDTLPELRLRIIEFVIDAIFLYPNVALTVKRLHDRNQSGMYAWALVAIVVVGMVMSLSGIEDDPSRMTFLTWVLAAFILVIVLAFLIELGFRRGTHGPNRYGPDPLEAHP
jgi:uncharacterized membrane protein YhaH (DUF805 family)